jgi:hypothetical protein
MIKKLIKLTINWQPRWLMHVIGTILICTPLNIALAFIGINDIIMVGEMLIRAILSATLIYWLADIWESNQPRYSFGDVYLSVLISIIYAVCWSI